MFSASSLVLAPVGPEHKNADIMLTFPSKGLTEPTSTLVVNSVSPLQLLPYLQCSQAMQANAVESVEPSALSLKCCLFKPSMSTHIAIEAIDIYIYDSEVHA